MVYLYEMEDFLLAKMSYISRHAETSNEFVESSDSLSLNPGRLTRRATDMTNKNDNDDELFDEQPPQPLDREDIIQGGQLDHLDQIDKEQLLNHNMISHQTKIIPENIPFHTDKPFGKLNENNGNDESKSSISKATEKVKDFVHDFSNKISTTSVPGNLDSIEEQKQFPISSINNQDLIEKQNIEIIQDPINVISPYEQLPPRQNEQYYNKLKGQ